MIQKKIRNLSTYKKLILLFLLIILPLIVLGTILVSASSIRVSEEINRSVYAQITNFLSNFEDDIDRIQRLAYDAMTDHDINTLAKMPDLYINNYERSQAVLRIQRRITAIHSSSRLISNVRVLIPSIGWAINSEGYYKGSYTDITAGEVEAIGALKPSTDSRVAFYNDRLILPMPVYVADNNNVWFLIEIEFSRKEWSQVFEKAINYENTQYIFAQRFTDLVLSDIQEDKDVFWNQDFNRSATGIHRLTVRGMRYVSFSQYFPYMDAYFIKYIPEQTLHSPIQLLALISLLFYLLVAVCICAYFIITNRMINKPMIALVKGFQTVNKRDFSVRLENENGSDFGYLYREFNRMASNLQVLIEQVYEQKLLRQRAEMKQLQTQITPHFLYNTYFMLHRLVKRDPERAVDFSKNMGTYFKYITRNDAELGSLEEESEHARIYAEIQTRRFEGRIRVVYGEIPNGYEQIPVPRIILQPLIENAFVHGLENKAENGLLEVQFKANKNGISILVQDDGECLTEEGLANLRMRLNETNSLESVAETTGMINIHRRIRGACAPGSGLYIGQSEFGGFLAEIRILKNV